MCHDNQRELEMHDATSEERVREWQASRQSIRPCSVTRMNRRGESNAEMNHRQKGREERRERTGVNSSCAQDKCYLFVSMILSFVIQCELQYRREMNKKRKSRFPILLVLFKRSISSHAKGEGTFLGQSEYRQYSRGLEEKQMKKLISISTYQIKQLQ